MNNENKVCLEKKNKSVARFARTDKNNMIFKERMRNAKAFQRLVPLGPQAQGKDIFIFRDTNTITIFGPPLPPSNHSYILLPTLVQTHGLFFSTNCNCMHICILYTYIFLNVTCLDYIILLDCIFLGLTIWCQTTNWCVLQGLDTKVSRNAGL